MSAHPSFQFLDHRPWPLPEERWTWRQSWLHLAFVHYRVALEDLEQCVPNHVRIQTFDGSAWVGLVPFLMSGVMRRPFPDLPGFSSFPELNLRTYVEVSGKPGVWFFSLDAASLPVVLGGKHLYNLPYHHAKMSLDREVDTVEFSSARRLDGSHFSARYRPTGPVFVAKPGSFEHWATERYCLYSVSRNGALSCVDVHHAPWPVQPAEIEIRQNDILKTAGIITEDAPPSCHFSTGVDVVSYRKRGISAC